MMKVDTGAFGANNNVLLTDADLAIVPLVAANQIPVVEGGNVPTFSDMAGDYKVIAPAEVGFGFAVTTSLSAPLDVEIAKFSRFDDETVVSSNAPSLSYNSEAGTYWFSWNSIAGDIGIWRLELSACDDDGRCASKEVTIQVVGNSEYLVELESVESSVNDYPTEMIIGNFDGDEFSEIVTVGSGLWYTNEFSLYDYENNGGFDYVAQSGYLKLLLKGLAVEYFNDDELLDVLYFYYGNSSYDEIAVRFGDGANGFGSSVISAAPLLSGTRGVTGNFNGDGRLDYVTAGGEQARVFFGGAGATFGFKWNVDIGDSIVSLNAADFNFDGREDLAIGTRTDLRVYLGNGNGTFILKETYPQTYGSVDIEITNQGSDFNGDGIFDLCVATPSIGDTASELIVYYGRGDGTFVQSVLRTVLGQVVATAAGDFNNDGLLDIGYLNSSKRYLALLFGEATGGFVNELRFFIPSYFPWRLGCFDADLDGDIDVGVFSFQPGVGSSLYLFENGKDPGGFRVSSVALMGEDNAQFELVSESGMKLNRSMNSMSSASYHRRDLNSNEMLDDFVKLEVVENGQYSLTVARDGSQAEGTPFTVEFTVDGKLHRLAKEAVMASANYDFGINLSGGGSVAPIPGNFIHINPPLFAWPGGAEMDFQLATDLDFYSIVIDTTINSVTYQPANALTVADTTTYYWRIKPSGTGEFGPIYAFNLVAGSAACGDVDGIGGTVNFLDLVFMTDNFFRGGPDFPDLLLADLDNDGRMSIVDMTVLIDYLFRSGAAPVCE
jgi:hypothetical protein